MTGGTPQTDEWNAYLVEVDTPTQRYGINAGQTGNPYCDPLDYERTIIMNGGATLTLSMDASGTSMRACSLSGW